jgi:hypothetical protein
MYNAMHSLAQRITSRQLEQSCKSHCNGPQEDQVLERGIQHTTYFMKFRQGRFEHTGKQNNYLDTSLFILNNNVVNGTPSTAARFLKVRFCWCSGISSTVFLTSLCFYIFFQSHLFLGEARNARTFWSWKFASLRALILLFCCSCT